MKKILLGLALITRLNGLSQETEFKLTKDGFTDFVVTPVEKTQIEMYKKTLDWVSVTFQNPKEVIKAQIENDYIRIEGSIPTLLCKEILLSTICDNAKYQIEISFKQGKYKFDVIEINGFTLPSEYTHGGWYKVRFDYMKTYFKENGDVRSVYKNYPTAFSETFNGLNNSLKDFLISDNIPSKKNDW
ncbi:DUF4468 domain-containing protein [Flavobacterium psychrophilum]|nr:DUF4468 domain-containing protein [Flavobacterium psychrophilum]ELM3672275.1 DUF4468 domain-containing protein [Flavobacterium psychrophilum]ELM3726823.1 DUF4468 domain-containing protein [Flavobacterium psychrophilum]